MEKTIMGYTAEDIRGQKIVFKCKSEELAKDLIKTLYDMGFKWKDGIAAEETIWANHRLDTVYGVCADGLIYYGNGAYYETSEVLDYHIYAEQKTYKAWELEEDVVYAASEVGYAECLKVGDRVKFDGRDIFLPDMREEGPLSSRLTMFGLKNLEFTEVEWRPRHEEPFFYPVIDSATGYRSSISGKHCEVEKKIKEKVGIYKTPKEAIEKAKELGWI